MLRPRWSISGNDPENSPLTKAGGLNQTSSRGSKPMNSWQLKSPKTAGTVFQWECLWHVFTTIFILSACFFYHRHQSSGYQTIVENMDKLLAERQQNFAGEMDELKISHEADVSALRKQLRTEMFEKRHSYRQELAKLELDYQAAVKIHDDDMNAHNHIASQLQGELDRHAQFQDAHANIESTASTHMKVTKESLAQCEADVKELSAQLKGREGAEVDAAMKDLAHKLDDLMASYTQVKASPGDASLLSKLSDQYRGIEELTVALESVIATPDFATEKPREPIQEAVNRAKSLLDIAKPALTPPQHVN